MVTGSGVLGELGELGQGGAHPAVRAVHQDGLAGSHLRGAVEHLVGRQTGDDEGLRLCGVQACGDRDHVVGLGTSSPRHHAALRELGVRPLDYDDPALAARVRELAPAGVDAVFDHIGGASIARSWSVLAEGGTLVSYALLKDTAPMVPAFFALLGQLAWLNALPGMRRAGIFDVWAGHVLRPRRFRARLHQDLSTVFSLLGDGTLRPQIAARLPLTEIREAVVLAESRTVVGKVILLP